MTVTSTSTTTTTTTPAHASATGIAASLRPTPLRTALRLAADPSRWRPHLDFDPDSRYVRRLVADEHHEAWLLTWLPGQGTAWHDHGGSGGAFVVLQGVLVERTAVHGVVRGARHVHRRGVAQAFGPDHVHRVGNEGPDPAVSLHVYMPRLEVQHEYVNDDGILRRTTTRREGEDW
ncbi:MAG TPA: cysteine dioxygenase family protein [Ornithinibacter sp.]|nr:cysteine dioxygenase family protein [Ornithinibacter sp.]